MGKIILSSRVAESLGKILTKLSVYELIENHANVKVRGNSYIDEEYKFLNDYDISQLCKILFEGYEIEKTEDELLLELYNDGLKICECKNEEIGYGNGFADCLSVLGKKVKGINA